MAGPMVTIVHIRKATLEDAAVSFAVRREAIRAQCRDHYPADDLAVWTSGDMSETFAARVAETFHVAVVDGHVVGTAMIDLATGRIDAVFVLPEYMRRGMGRALMDHLEGMAISAGLAALQLDATLNAASFYRSLGFEGDERTVYHSSLGVSLACVPMVKHLRSV
jgi:GNAT superfamily N-acetyltransferase